MCREGNTCHRTKDGRKVDVGVVRFCAFSRPVDAGKS